MPERKCVTLGAIRQSSEERYRGVEASARLFARVAPNVALGLSCIRSPIGLSAGIEMQRVRHEPIPWAFRLYAPAGTARLPHSVADNGFFRAQRSESASLDSDRPDVRAYWYPGQVRYVSVREWHAGHTCANANAPVLPGRLGLRERLFRFDIRRLLALGAGRHVEGNRLAFPE